MNHSTHQDCADCRISKLHTDALDLLVNAVAELYPELRHAMLDRGVAPVVVELLHTAKGGGVA